MASESATAGMHLLKQNLIVTMASEVDDFDLRNSQKQILAKMETDFIKGVLIDVSQIRVLDSTLFAILSETSQMIKLLGGTTIFSGFKPQVASSLVELEIDFENIETVITMEDGLDKLRLVNDLAEKTTQENQKAETELLESLDSQVREEDA